MMVGDRKDDKTSTSVHITVTIYHKLDHSYFAYCLKISPLLLYGRVPFPTPDVTFLKYRFA